MIRRRRKQETNKKIRGATKQEYKGIRFDSKLELFCYKHLETTGIPFVYNTKKYNLLERFRLNKLNLFEVIRAKKKTIDFNVYKTQKGDKRIYSQITYTPDFVIEVKNILIFVETKGYFNDVYPIKRKMFFSKLENDEKYSGKIVYFFEPRNQKQVLISINEIKKILKYVQD